MRLVFSILYYMFFFLSGIILIVVAGLIWTFTVFFDKKLCWLHQYTQWWGRLVFLVVRAWRVEVVGVEKINSHQASVLVSNHQSDFDILLGCFLRSHFKWVSKSENFKVPIVGLLMRMNRYISIKRGDRKSILKMIRESISTIENGSSIYIFPEGTRSVDGKIRRMSSGAFVIAQKAKVGVQPIVIDGTRHIMNKEDWVLNFKVNVRIEVLDEIPYEELKDKSTSELANMVKEMISARLELS